MDQKHTKYEAMEILAGAGVACGAVLDSAEVLSNEHLRARGMVVDLEHPERGRFPMLGNPVRLSASPTEVHRAPLLGEHTAEVLAGLLGLSAEEVAHLKRGRRGLTRLSERRYVHPVPIDGGAHDLAEGGLGVDLVVAVSVQHDQLLGLTRPRMEAD